MTPSEILDDRHELLETVETFHGRREHLHQLPALLGHVALEHPLEGGIQLEQPPVEQRRGIIGNRGDQRQSFAAQGLSALSVNIG